MTATNTELLGQVDVLCRRLRLPYLRKAASEVLATARSQRWDPVEALRVLLDEEAKGRDASMRETRRRRAGFPTGKTFHDWNPGASSIPAAVQQALRTLEWVERRENLVVVGPSGTGKSRLLEALGLSRVTACIRCGICSRRLGCGAGRWLACCGATSTSTRV